MILTSQRLIHLTESIPPGNTNIRYGFHSHIGSWSVLAEQVSLPAAKLRMCSEWRALGGTTAIEWEMPAYNRAALGELISFLEAFKG